MLDPPTDFRQTFREIIQAHPGLGQLANEIATVEEPSAGQFLSSRRGKRWYNNPANFLVNGAWEETLESRPGPRDPALFTGKDRVKAVEALEEFLGELREWKAKGLSSERARLFPWSGSEPRAGDAF